MDAFDCGHVSDLFWKVIGVGIKCFSYLFMCYFHLYFILFLSCCCFSCSLGSNTANTVIIIWGCWSGFHGQLSVVQVFYLFLINHCPASEPIFSAIRRVSLRKYSFNLLENTNKNINPESYKSYLFFPPGYILFQGIRLSQINTDAIQNRNINLSHCDFNVISVH